MKLLAHRVQGEGEPLLVLNGGLMTYEAWGPVSSRLRRSYSLIHCDLRGQLLSPGPAPVELAGNVDDLVALLDHLGVERTHLLGTSYGGEIALLFAALQPGRTRTLIAVTVSDRVTDNILVGSHDLRRRVQGRLSRENKVGLYDRLVEDVYSPSFRERFGEELRARRSQVAELPDAWFRDLEGILAAMEGLDLRPHTDSIRCPTLVVMAAEDRVILPERTRALAVAIAGAELAVHETSGHALVAEDPAWLAARCLEFLARHSAG